MPEHRERAAIDWAQRRPAPTATRCSPCWRPAAIPGSTRLVGRRSRWRGWSPRPTGRPTGWPRAPRSPLAHTLAQTGPFRPRNLRARAATNVVLAGCGTTPGVGIPPVLISGRLAAQRITGAAAERQRPCVRQAARCGYCTHDRTPSSKVDEPASWQHGRAPSSPLTAGRRAGRHPRWTPARSWHDRFGRPPRGPLLLGLVASLMMLVGGFGAGGVLRPRPDPDELAARLLALRPRPRARHRCSIYGGVGLMLWAWIQLGREVLADRVGGRAVLTTAAGVDRSRCCSRRRCSPATCSATWPRARCRCRVRPLRGRPRGDARCLHRERPLLLAGHPGAVRAAVHPAGQGRGVRWSATNIIPACCSCAWRCCPGSRCWSGRCPS